MVKKEKKKQSTIERSPYMYYVTNWGFVEQPIRDRSNKKSESLVTR